MLNLTEAVDGNGTMDPSLGSRNPTDAALTANSIRRLKSPCKFIAPGSLTLRWVAYSASMRINEAFPMSSCSSMTRK